MRVNYTDDYPFLQITVVSDGKKRRPCTCEILSHNAIVSGMITQIAYYFCFSRYTIKLQIHEISNDECQNVPFLQQKLDKVGET